MEKRMRKEEKRKKIKKREKEIREVKSKEINRLAMGTFLLFL